MKKKSVEAEEKLMKRPTFKNKMMTLFFDQELLYVLRLACSDTGHVDVHVSLSDMCVLAHTGHVDMHVLASKYHFSVS